MDGRPSESLMPLTRRLAEMLADESGARVLGQLQVLGLTAAGRGVARLGDATPSLGIWGAARAENGEVELVRDRGQRSSWRFWADVERLGPKRGTRVVLLGESAARGYLYDPALTPARLLGEMLGGIEVVDLAASDLPQPGLDSLIAATPTLAPDAIVLFAGNNWHNVLFGLDELQELAGALRAGGHAALRATMQGRVIAPRARATMDTLAASARGIPVVVVVPEFALGDWRAESSALAPVLARGDNARWMRVRAEALRARDGGDLERAAALGRELVTIDGGTCALGFELIGDAARAQGDPPQARAAFEAARDAVYGLPVAHSPRCPRLVQDVLRAKAAEHGFALVDLPRLFEAELAGDLPDRRLFLDYCHLSALGMRVAMDAVADALAPRLRAQRRTAAAPLTAEDEATAHVLAAIHNAHQGQPEELLRHHLRRAAELSDHACDQMAWYLEVHASEAEQWMCAAFDRLCESPLVRRYLDAADPRVSGRLADVALVAAMSSVLADAGRVAPPTDGVARRLDLLAPRHHARSFRDRNAAFGPPRGYVQARDLVSRFAFDRREASRLRARLCCRLPGVGDGDVVRVRLNGDVVEEITVGPRWSTHEIDVAARAGANELEIEWPLREVRWAEMLELDARRLERAVYPDALPAYGEIYELTLATGAFPSSPRPRR